MKRWDNVFQAVEGPASQRCAAAGRLSGWGELCMELHSIDTWRFRESSPPLPPAIAFTPTFLFNNVTARRVNWIGENGQGGRPGIVVVEPS